MKSTSLAGGIEAATFAVIAIGTAGSSVSREEVWPAIQILGLLLLCSLSHVKRCSALSSPSKAMFEPYFQQRSSSPIPVERYPHSSLYAVALGEPQISNFWSPYACEAAVSVLKFPQLLECVECVPAKAVP